MIQLNNNRNNININSKKKEEEESRKETEREGADIRRSGPIVSLLQSLLINVNKRKNIYFDWIFDLKLVGLWSDIFYMTHSHFLCQINILLKILQSGLNNLKCSLLGSNLSLFSVVSFDDLINYFE